MTDEMTLTVFDPARAMVADLVKKDAAQQLDHTTAEGEKALRSWVHRVKGGKGDIEKTRKVTKADALAFGKKVDALAKELTEPLQGIIDARMKPLNEIEAKKRAEAEAIVEAERVAAEKAEQERIADLERREAEMAEKERIVKEAEIAAEAKAQAERDAELAILRAEDEKKRAEANAKAAAEQAEREKQEAIAKVKAEAKAKADKEAYERQCEEHRIQAEKDAADKAEAARVADGKHQDMVKGRIYDAIQDVVDDHKIAQKVLDALILDEIPHVKIEY